MSEYVFDQAWEQERERLANLEGWLDPGTIRHLDEIGVAPGWRCLEIGGGGGSIARWLCARTGPAGAVLATDLDTRFLDAIDEQNLEVRRHDIVAEPLEEDAFDLAHTRLLLEHLPGREEGLKRMVAALRPGGWILVEDMEMVTHVSVTPSEAYERVKEAMQRVMAGAGFDGFLGRRLAGMLEAAGLEDVAAEGRILFGARANNPGIEMYRLTLTHLRAPIVSAGLADDADFDEVFRLLGDPAFRAMPPAIVAAWGRKPASR